MTNPDLRNETVKRDDFELRIVEAKPLSSAPKLTSFPAINPRPAPTSTDAVEALRATKGARAIIDLIPALSNASLLTQVASWSPVSASGSAAGAPVFWGADFISYFWDLQMAYSNRTVYFAGHEFIGEIHKPNVLDGRVWCEMDAPTAGYYLFVAQFETYTDDLFSPGYFSSVIFSINGQTIGMRILIPGTAPNFPFVLNLPAGMNRFEINQHTGAMFFQSLTAFQVPISGSPES